MKILIYIIISCILIGINKQNIVLLYVKFIKQCFIEQVSLKQNSLKWGEYHIVEKKFSMLATIIVTLVQASSLSRFI